MRRASSIIAILLTAAVTGCGGNDFQSALHPASDEARAMAWLWWVMAWVYGAVFVVTMGFAAAALIKKRDKDSQAPGGAVRFVVIAGIVVPTAILLVMLIIALRAGSAIRAPEAELTIEITGHQWWWDVRYPEAGIVTANEIRLPVGVPVRLELTSADVIHSFWVPNLHGKIDMIPDHVSRFWLQAEREGVFRGACAELCGDQHALMGLDVVVMPRDEFDAWLDERRAPTPAAAAGLELFKGAGCAACHALGGTEAVADLGPDLTHLAERRNLAAAHLPVNRETLVRWISDPQSMKPGNLMPPTDLSPDDLRRLVDFLLTPR